MCCTKLQFVTTVVWVTDKNRKIISLHSGAPRCCQSEMLKISLNL